MRYVIILVALVFAFWAFLAAGHWSHPGTPSLGVLEAIKERQQRMTAEMEKILEEQSPKEREERGKLEKKIQALKEEIKRAEQLPDDFSREYEEWKKNEEANENEILVHEISKNLCWTKESTKRYKETSDQLYARRAQLAAQKKKLIERLEIIKHQRDQLVAILIDNERQLRGMKERGEYLTMRREILEKEAANLSQEKCEECRKARENPKIRKKIPDSFCDDCRN